MIFSADETTDIGYESGTTVTPDYTAATSRFTGKINWVQIDLGDDDHDHFIDPRGAPPHRHGPAVAASLRPAELLAGSAGTWRPDVVVGLGLELDEPHAPGGRRRSRGAPR